MRGHSQNFDPRQVMQASGFEVFHYREPRPADVEVHHHDFYEVYYLLGGQVEYWVEGRIIRMGPGDLLFINPMELHRPVINPVSPVYERIVLWIDRSFLEGLSPEASLSRCFDPSLPNLMRPSAAERTMLTALFQDLVKEHYSKEYESSICAKGLFLQLMVLFNRLALHGEGAQQEQQLSPLVNQALQWIGEHIREDLSLEELARVCFVSKYHLSHAFSREMGISVHRYIMLRRLLMARQLLAEGEAAGQVCTDCGFCDYTSFYRAFKAEYGVSPKAFAESGR